MITSFSVSLFSPDRKGGLHANTSLYNTAVSSLCRAVAARRTRREQAPHLLQFILDTVSTQTLHCWRWRFSCWLGATRVGRQTGVGTREPAGHNREISHLISVEERTVNYCQCNPQGDDQWAMWELVSCLFVKIVRTTNLTTNREKWSETQMATF